MITHLCPCGAELIKKVPQGPWPMYCSRRCRGQAYYQRTGKLTKVSAYMPVVHVPRPCPACGESFTAWAQQKTCSKLCQQRWRKANATRCSVDGCLQPAVGRGLCSYHHRSSDHSVTFKRECARCKQPFTTKLKRTLFCSISCGKRTRGADLVPWVAPPTTPTTPLPARLFTCVECPGCHEFYLVERRATGPRSCSPECAAKARQAKQARVAARRRARMRATQVEDVHPYRIFTRDNWICHICQEPLARGEKVPHPQAPTMDHVIPLAAGGSHTYENIRAAHFLCNSAKGAEMLLVA